MTAGPGVALGEGVGLRVALGSWVGVGWVGSSIGGPGVHAVGCSGWRKDNVATTSNTASTATPTSTTTHGADPITVGKATRP
ncbi:hypothetical protein [Micromonospora sp. NBC_01739]|uniref:hypothetical protein n=1 Tax=Micromonospora sp. NBC_01739 TaxID=2975985 RepID=UPI002E1064CA|nr:hypothetical protein OIE53_03010 [Micromonospora sp. NBC_01739]